MHVPASAIRALAKGRHPSRLGFLNNVGLGHMTRINYAGLGHISRINNVGLPGSPVGIPGRLLDFPGTWRTIFFSLIPFLSFFLAAF